MTNRLDSPEYWKLKNAVADAQWALNFLPDLQALVLGSTVVMGQFLSKSGEPAQCAYQLLTAQGQVIIQSGWMSLDSIRETSHDRLRDDLVQRIVETRQA